MALQNPFKITYGSRSVGGSSSRYLLNGPYVIDKAFDSLRVVFDVIVSATSFADLHSDSDDLENDFRKRDQNLVIELDSLRNPGASKWTYTSGTSILNVRANLAKSGDIETDRGYSRSYTCIIEGELPVDDVSASTGSVTGLREISINVDHEAGRQRIVTFQGVYTATESPAALATANYEAANGADIEASTFLAALTPSATFELVDENYVRDRNDHTCTFMRQYVELLANQSSANLDDDKIRDHRMTFTDLSQHPSDGRPGIYRLRRVIGSYDAAIDIRETTDLQATVEDVVIEHVKGLFETNFAPVTFAIEDMRLSYDETTKRVSCAIQFVYQKSGGDNVIEISQTGTYRESRTIDYTPVHGKDELAFYADPGWMVLEYVLSRTAIVMGGSDPQRRLSESKVEREGWNMISNTSQIMPQYVGDPDHGQYEVGVLTETVVWRYTNKPSGSGEPPTKPPSDPKSDIPNRGQVTEELTKDAGGGGG